MRSALTKVCPEEVCLEEVYPKVCPEEALPFLRGCHQQNSDTGQQHKKDDKSQSSGKKDDQSHINEKNGNQSQSNNAAKPGR